MAPFSTGRGAVVIRSRRSRKRECRPVIYHRGRFLGRAYLSSTWMEIVLSGNQSVLQWSQDHQVIVVSHYGVVLSRNYTASRTCGSLPPIHLFHSRLMSWRCFRNWHLWLEAIKLHP